MLSERTRIIHTLFFTVVINQELKMNEMIQRLIEKTGLSEEQATTAADTVLQFLKEKLPSPLASQLDSLSDGANGRSGMSGGMSDKLGGIGGKLGSMFGNKQ
jgi:hypothetical protein